MIFRPQIDTDLLRWWHGETPDLPLFVSLRGLRGENNNGGHGVAALPFFREFHAGTPAKQLWRLCAR